MFAKIWTHLKEGSLRSALREGNLRCPACGGVHQGPVESIDHWLTCAECHEQNVAGDWVMPGGVPRGWANRPPENTVIERQVHDASTVSWQLPASGKSGGFLFFAILWCSICGAVTGGITAVLLFGEYTPPSDSTDPRWFVTIVILFFATFWVVGLGMFYIAARNKWGKTGIMVNAREVVMMGSLWGLKNEKRLARGEVRAVRVEAFYSNEDTPVHGVTVQAGKRSLKFGTMLRDDEKGWLAADLQRVLGVEPARPAKAASRTPPVERVASDAAFSLVIPRAARHLWPMAIALSVMGVLFLVFGMFFFDGGEGGGGSGDDAPAAVRIFDGIFRMVDIGFSAIWYLISTVSALIGFGLSLHLLRTRGVERRFEGDAAVVAIRKVRNGRVLAETVFPRGEVRDLLTTSSGSSNDLPMNRIELRIGDKSRTLAHWVDAGLAERFTAEASGYLWRA